MWRRPWLSLGAGAAAWDVRLLPLQQGPVGSSQIPTGDIEVPPEGKIVRGDGCSQADMDMQFLLL